MRCHFMRSPSWKQCFVASIRKIRPSLLGSSPDCFANSSTGNPSGWPTRKSAIFAVVTTCKPAGSSNCISYSDIRLELSKWYVRRTISNDPSVARQYDMEDERTFVITCPGLATAKLSCAHAASITWIAFDSFGDARWGLSKGPGSVDDNQGTSCPTF